MVTAAYFAAICIAIACFTGVGLTTSLLFPKVAFPLHFCFAPAAVITFLFCAEHFVPLGQLPFLWVPWLTWVGFLILRFPALKTHLFTPLTAYFLAAFFYCLFWRFSFPDICCLGEQLPDLGQLVSWSQGNRLPATDPFEPGEMNASFSCLQYYAAGLLHRFIGAQPGLSYHLGYCFLTGVAAAAVGEGIRIGAASRIGGTVGVAWLLLGGNGAAFLVPFMAKDQPQEAYQTIDFCSSFNESQSATLTPFGHWIVKTTGNCGVRTPMDTFSCAIMVGDFDPVLSGIALLGMAILVIGIAHRSIPQSETDRACVMLGVSTPVLQLVSNTELAAFQAILIGAWLFYRWLTGKKDSLWIVLTPLVASLCLIFPLLLALSRTSGPGFSFQSVKWEFSPLASWVIALAPGMALFILGLCNYMKGLLSRLKQREPGPIISGLAHFRIFILTTSFLALAAGLIFCGQVNENSISFYAWPWIYVTVVSLTLMSLSIGTFRTSALALLALTIVPNAYLMGLDWYRPLWVGWPAGTGGQKAHVGQLNGCAWEMDDGQDSDIFQVLGAQPRGTVLESAYLDPSDSHAGMGFFCGHLEAGSWTQHELRLRGNRPDLSLLASQRDDFYLGHAKDISWLENCVPGGVTYIIWQNRDNDRTLEAWPLINQQLKGRYDWKECTSYNQGEWGFWVKRPEIDDEGSRL